jgi:Tfp pilus assembly protein PilP
MKARTIVLLWVMASGMALAQTAPPSQKVAPDSKPAAAKPVKTKAKPAAAPASPAARSPMARKPAMAPAKAKVKPAATAGKKAAAATTTTAKAGPGKRDPFISPIREQGAAGPACTTGKKCLAIDTIVLRGIVKSQAGMIALVESSARKISYFLRENDPVFNGYVVKITGDTVVFRENVMDRVGKQSTRDVVMKVVAPVV